MKIIKNNIRSVCPVCINEVEGYIFEKNKGVFLKKKCHKHGTFVHQIERDINLYNASFNDQGYVDKISATKLTIPVIQECNLNCSYCYYPIRDRKSLTAQQVKDMIKQFPGAFIVLSGGEPTLRKDLPELIKYTNKLNKHVTLATNGLKLDDANYVKELKMAGLSQVHFSLNALSDKILNRIHHKKGLLKLKLRALGNLKIYKIPTMVSFLIQKNVNDNQVKRVWEYCLQNSSFIRSFRIRIPSPVGRYENRACYYASDVLKIVCNFTGVDYKQVIDTMANQKRDKKLCNINLFFLIYKKENNTKIISWRVFNIKKKTTIDIRIYRFFHKIIGRYTSHLYRVKHLVSFFLRLNPFATVRLLSNKMFCGGKFVTISVTIICWPNKYTIDLDRNKMCPSVTLNYKGEVMPFCYSNIYNNLFQVKNELTF